MGYTDSHVEYEHNLFIKQVNYVDLNITRTYLTSTHDLFINELVVSGRKSCQILSPLLTRQATFPSFINLDRRYITRCTNNLP